MKTFRLEDSWKTNLEEGIAWKRGGLDKKEGVVFLRGGWYPNAHYESIEVFSVK